MGNGAYLVGKGDLFDRGGAIWWERGAYLVGKGFFFFWWGMGALLGWGGELLDKRGPGSLYLYQCLQ